MDSSNPKTPPESQGGSGDVYSEGVKRDRLERMAIRQRWPVPEKYREPIMNRAITLLLDKQTPIRDFNQTLNAILKAEAQNQADEHKLAPDNVNINISSDGLKRAEYLEQVAARLLERQKAIAGNGSKN